MQQEILEVYNLGLEKFAGDEQKAKEFTVGFMKEAMIPDFKMMSPGQAIGDAALKGLGAGAASIALALGVNGLSKVFSSASQANLREKYLTALSIAVRNNPVLTQADHAKVKTYGDTIFNFAPHVAADSNLLSPLLANAIHGEGMDITTIKTLTDLEGRLVESRKNTAFSPKAYI